MIARFNRLLFAITLVFAALYIVIMNRSSATVTLGAGWSVEANIGVLLIIAFTAGLVGASLIALFFGFRGWLRERRLISRDKQTRAFLDVLLEGRGLLAAHRWDESQELWRALSRRDPTGIVARVELSRSLEFSGQLEEAVRLIEAVRSEYPDNLEALFRAFELHKKLGNRTAAIDNLALVLAKHPTLRAASEARDLSFELGKYSDAREYHEQCLDLGEERIKHARRGAEIEFRLLENDNELIGENKKKALYGFAKAHPEISAVHEVIARLEHAEGNRAGEAQALVAAAKAGAGLPAWSHAAQVWLSDGQPEKALAAARSALHGTTGIERIEALLFRAQLHLGFGQNQEALEVFEQIHELNKDNILYQRWDVRARIDAGFALAQLRLQKTEAVTAALAEASGFEQATGIKTDSMQLDGRSRELSPIYSTP